MKTLNTQVVSNSRGFCNQYENFNSHYVKNKLVNVEIDKNAMATGKYENDSYRFVIFIPGQIFFNGFDRKGFVFVNGFPVHANQLEIKDKFSNPELKPGEFQIFIRHLSMYRTLADTVARLQRYEIISPKGDKGLVLIDLNDVHYKIALNVVINP